MILAGHVGGLQAKWSVCQVKLAGPGRNCHASFSFDPATELIDSSVAPHPIGRWYQATRSVAVW